MLRTLLLACALFITVALPARAQTPDAQAPQAQAATPALTPDEARRALDMLQDDQKRAQLIDTLRAISATVSMPIPKPAAPPPAETPAAPTTAPRAAAPASPQTTPAAPAAGSTAPTATTTAPAATATPPATSAPAPPANGAAANGAAASPPAEAKKEATLDADGLGAQLLVGISRQMREWAEGFVDSASNVTRLPLLWGWVVATVTNPESYNLLLDIAWKLAIVLGGALVVEFLITRALRRPLAALETRMPWRARESAQTVAIENAPELATSSGIAAEERKRQFDLTRIWQSLLRLPFVLARFLLDLLPVVAFVGVANALLATEIGDFDTTRRAILAIVNAYALSRAIICAVRMVASSGPLSLVTIAEETAAYVELWTHRLVYVGVFGIAVANVAFLLGLYRVGYFALIRIVLLIVHLLIVVIILQCRHPVANAIRPAPGARGAASMFRNRLADVWHLLASALVIAVWGIWAFNVRDGYALLLQYLAGTLAVIVISRLLTVVTLGLIDRLFRVPPELLHRFPALENRANLYLPLLRKVVTAIIGVLTFIALLQIWGANTVVWFYGGQIGGKLLSAVITIGIAALAAVVVWEISNAAIDGKLQQLTGDGHYARAARLRTFQPMLRTALLCVIVAVVGLTALSEVGVNVAPLLAGAGIVGVAVGFGSQKLVQDLITGLFLLLENVVQVGDTVTVSGLSGVVENLSIRTIRLRAGDGSVHVVPFSAVTTITNASRGVGNASVNISIAFKEDTDRASAILKDIGAGLREDPAFRHLIRSDLQLWGVDKVDGAMVTIVGQIPCSDAGRWSVQREFNRRLKRRFQEEGIEIAGAANPTIIIQAAAAPETEKRETDADTPPGDQRSAAE